MDEINQCDGCQSGVPLDRGFHRPRIGGVFACTADRYAAPLTWPDLTAAQRDALMGRDTSRAHEDPGRDPWPPGADHPEREHRPLPGCGIVTAVLMVLFCLAVAYVLTESAWLLRSSK